MDQGIGPTDNLALEVPVSTTNGDCRSSTSSKWHFCGHVFPRSEIVFFIQVTMVFIVSIVSIVNITMNHPDSQLWIALLSSSVGYLLPSPNLK
jgi:hypothetical protein